MAVTTVDRRITIDEGDTNTNWNAGNPTTTSFAEGIASIAIGYGEATGDLFADDGTNRDLSNTLIYVYSQIIATLLTWNETDDPPHALYLGDGANAVAFYQSGNNRDVFKHSDGPVGFQCFVLDGSQASAKISAGEATALTGTTGGFITNIGVVTEYGAHYSTQSKALGGGVNCYCDIIRYGNDGIRIIGGDSTDQGNFLEVVLEDRSIADGKAHGIIREYTPGIYGCQGPLTFGDTAGTNDSYFNDDGVVLAYEDRDIGDDKYYFNIEGNLTGTNSFILSNATITTAGPLVSCDFSVGDIDTLTLDTVVFAGLGNSISFSDGTDSTGHTVSGSTFEGCGQIDPGTITFEGSTVSNSTSASTGAILLDSAGSSNWSDITVISGDGTEDHGIYITTDGTYDFTGIVGIGFDTTTGGSGAFIYNDSSGDVVINANESSSGLSYLDGTGSTTTIVSTIDWYFRIEDQSGTLVTTAEFRTYSAANNELYGVETSSGTEHYAFNATLAGQTARIVVHDLDHKYFSQILVHPSSSNTSGSPTTFVLIIDRVYENP